MARWSLRAALALAPVVVALALPAGASATFTPQSPFSISGDTCPDAVGLLTGSDGSAQQVFVGDPCGTTDLDDFTPAGSLTGFDGIGPAGPCGIEGRDFTAVGIAADPTSGDVYVTDPVYSESVFEFGPTGNFIASLGGGSVADGCSAETLAPYPGVGSGPGYFNDPRGVAIDGGTLLVADAGDDEVQEVPLGLGPVSAITEFSAPDPTAVAVDPTTGVIFVTDGNDPGSVEEYSSSGRFIESFVTGLDRPDGIAVDAATHVVFVSVSGSGEIETFDEDTAAPLQTLTATTPEGIAIDPVNDVLYVADQGADVLQPYSFSPPPACGDQPLRSTEVGVALNLTLDCYQPDDEAPVSYAIDRRPSHGVLSGLDSSTGAVTYTPAPGFSGFDSFTYVGASADGTSVPVTVTIDVADFSSLAPFAGTIPEPSALAIVPDAAGGAQSVWVTAQGDNDVEQYTPDGQTAVGSIPSTFTCQETNETFDDPLGLAVDPATDDLYVSDSGDSRIIEFDPNGQFIAQAGGGEVSNACGVPSSPDNASEEPTPGYFDEPGALGAGDGSLWIVDDEFGNIDSMPLGFGSLGDADALAAFDPSSVAVDGTTGKIFVTTGYGTVEEYDRAGNDLGAFTDGFDGYGFGDGGGPNLVAVDPVAGVVYVEGTIDAGPDDVGDDQPVTGIFSYDEATGAPLQELATGLGDSVAMAVDPVNHVLYVADDSGNTVERIALQPAPSCAGQPAASTAYETSAALTLDCSDSAGAALTYALAGNPAHGALSGFNPATGAVTYTPNAGYSGPDSFTFDATSENGTSRQESVDVDVAAPAQTAAPNCAPETLTTPYETALPLTLACSVPNAPSASPSSYAIVAGPSNGTLSSVGSDGSLSYTPAVGFVGEDSFTFTASYDGVTSAPERITIYVGKTLPPPVLDHSLNAYHAAGSVYVYLPGQHHRIRLVAGIQLPDGSVIDADDGRVGVFVAVDEHGDTQHGDFYGGTFSFAQTHGGHPLAVLQLLGAQIVAGLCAYHPQSFGGSFPGGISYSQAIAYVAKAAKKAHFGKPVRQLWGHAHGDFKTVGNGSSASVRGTRWAIFDYPDGTLTFVYKDTVAVYDFHLHKTVYVTAGHFYFAALGNLPPC